SAAVTAAETGHLVLSTLHTTGAAKTVDRIIDVFPPHAQGQIRSQLAGVLKGVVTQQLLPMTPDPLTKKPRGRIAATEVMIGTDAILNLIRESKAHQINSVIQSGANLGMMTMDSCLANYVRNGFITPDVARQYAMKPEELRQFLR
ncbi:MAG: Flp pilus assembly complex ATPase component TadA, partial [Clostridiales bacterium]|nr:Flp pilus assembly complex ATPase component TadA [Clostridiales bacterium]